MNSDLSLNPNDWRYKVAKIKKRDLIKIRLELAADMENFLKLKGLYNEFYDRYIVPELVLNLKSDDIINSFTEVVSNA